MRSIDVDRPWVPDGYGLPETNAGLLEWADVEARLVESLHYWMSSTRPDGRPHVVPRWGVWVDNCLWYDGAPTTIHVQNLASNGACTLHLEDGAQAIIVDGTAGPTDPPPGELAVRISQAMCSKYEPKGYAPPPDSWSGPNAGGLCRFVPSKALAWFDFPKDMTRFRF